MNAHEKEMRSWALRYARKFKWRVFPLQPGTTTPFPGTHGHKDATSDLKTIRRWWTEEYRGANIGAVNDSKVGPIVVDIDAKAAEPFLKALGLPATLEATSGRDGSRHLYYDPNGATIRRMIRPIERDGEKVPFDVLGDGGYVVLPPSYRSDIDQKYRWLKKRPRAPFPKNFLRAAQQASRQSSNGRDNGREESPPFDLRKSPLPDVIPEGERDTSLTSLAGSMRRRRAGEKAILAALRQENEEKCDPPLPDKQLKKIATSIGQKDPDKVETACRELNRTWAAVSIGGKMMYLEERPDGTIEFWPRLQFIAKLEAQMVWVPKGARGELVRRPVSKAWLEWEGRREYDRVVFEPGVPERERVFNLWRGFTVEPSAKGSCDLFLAHVFENVCQGKQSRYDWVLDWFAQLVQAPMSKLGTSLVLRGPQGVGKTIVGKTIGRLLGGHYFLANSPRYVTGRFNAHLERVLLLHADEAFWAGDKQELGVLKDLITNDVQAIERKGLESITVANHLRLFVTSNAQWAVPAGLQDRRFAVFDVGDARQQDTRYFAAIQRQLDAGGYAKLLHTLQHQKVDEPALRKVPKTAARREQIEASLAADDAWLVEAATAGGLPSEAKVVGERAKVAIEQLHAAYVERAKIVGIGHRASLTAFGIWLRRWFPQRRGEPTPTVRLYGTQRRAIWLPSLAKVRARIDERIGRRKWGEPTEWQVGGL